MAFAPQAQRTSPADRAIGLAAFAAAVILLRLLFGCLTRVVGTVKRRRQRAATPAEAETAAAAARTAGRWFPGRAACLENSPGPALPATAACLKGAAVTSPAPVSPPVQAALDSVDENGYTRQPDGTRVPQSSSPLVIAAMLDLLDIETGMRVLEIGTGSGYSTALLSHLVGDDGHITSVEIDRILTARAEQLLDHDGRHNTDLITGDGVQGAPGFRDHFHRVIAWATVKQIPGAWAVQAAPAAILVIPVNLTGLPKTHAIIRARCEATIPGFTGDTLIPGGFVEAHDRVLDQWLVPPLGVDVLTHDDDDKPWWLSAHWLRTRSHQQTGRDLLDQLIINSRTVPGPLTAEDNGADFHAYLLATRPPGLSTAAFGDPIWRIGYSNPAGTALIPTGEGRTAVHAGHPSAHHHLLSWAKRWQSLGRPRYAHLRPQLHHDEHGWHVRAALGSR